MSDIDDILDAACDDVDDMLDLAADELMNEPSSTLVHAEQQSAGSRTVPKVWQEALNVLDVKTKIEWAGIIQSDISKQSKEQYSSRPHSKAYVSGKLSGRENLAKLTYDEIFGEILRRSLRSRNNAKSLNVEEMVRLLETDESLVRSFKAQISADLRKRLRDLETL